MVSLHQYFEQEFKYLVKTPPFKVYFENKQRVIWKKLGFSFAIRDTVSYWLFGATRDSVSYWLVGAAGTFKASSLSSSESLLGGRCSAPALPCELSIKLLNSAPTSLLGSAQPASDQPESSSIDLPSPLPKRTIFFFASDQSEGCPV